MANILPSTQSHLDFSDISEGIVWLKNGNAAIIIETNSLNFILLSEEEQEVKIIAFSNFINSINFPLQILISTQKADVNNYIAKLEKARDEHQSPTLKKQMDIYMRFVKNLTIKSEILNKRFYIVIKTNFSFKKQNSSLFSFLNLRAKPKADNSADKESSRKYLFPKRDYILKQINKMGLKGKALEDKEIIQALYDSYMPDKNDMKKVDFITNNYNL